MFTIWLRYIPPSSIVLFGQWTGLMLWYDTALPGIFEYSVFILTVVPKQDRKRCCIFLGSSRAEQTFYNKINHRRKQYGNRPEFAHATLSFAVMPRTLVVFGISLTWYKGSQNVDAQFYVSASHLRFKTFTYKRVKQNERNFFMCCGSVLCQQTIF